MMTANKIEYKDVRLVILPTDAITHKPDSLVYPWSLLFSSCRVSLAEYNRVLRVLFPLLQVIEGYLELTLCVETSWWAQRGFLHATTVVFIYNPH